jgi:hypothetical protein
VDTENTIKRTPAEPSVRDVRSLQSNVRDVELLSGRVPDRNILRTHRSTEQSQADGYVQLLQDLIVGTHLEVCNSSFLIRVQGTQRY